MASIQFSWISTAKARVSRRQDSALGKMRTTKRAPLQLLHQPLEHVRAFQMLVVLPREAVEAERGLDVLFHPQAQLGIARGCSEFCVNDLLWYKRRLYGE